MHHSIKIAARMTGLTPHVIRVWERRYGAVTPARTGTNRRLYSDEELERLALLGQVTRQGHSISMVANLATAALRALIAQDVTQGGPDSGQRGRNGAPSADAFVQRCLDAIAKLDGVGLEEGLAQGILTLGHQGLLQRIIAPLTKSVGDLWRQGTLSAAHEHFASAVIRVFLGNATRPFAVSGSAPGLVVATPAGQLHELGAVIVAAAAVNLGWRVTYLGTSLPAAEIAGAALQNRARAVALSIVYPEDDPQLPQELEALRRFLPADIRIVTGGRAAASYREALHRIGAAMSLDVDEFSRLLDGMRGSG